DREERRQSSASKYHQVYVVVSDGLFIPWWYRSADRLASGFFRVKYGDTSIDMFVWTRNDMSCRDLSDLACSLRARFDCRTDSTNFTANDSRHKSSVNFLIADKCDIGSFHHGISRLDHGDQTPAFNHSKSF